MDDAADRCLPIWAERLLALMNNSGLSQSEVARRAGITRDAMSRYCVGRTRPPTAKLEKIAKVLDVHPTDIDPVRLSRVQAPKRTREPFVMRPSEDRGDGYVRLIVDMDVSRGRISEVLRILNEEKGRSD